MIDLYQVQEDLEKKNRVETQQRFQTEHAKKMQRGEQASTYFGSPLMKRAIAPMVELITARQAASKKGVAMNANIALKHISKLKPEVVAYITARVLIDRVTMTSRIQDAAIRVAAACEDELRYISFDNQHPHLFKKIQSETNTTDKRKRQTLIAAYNRYCEAWSSWPKTDQVHVGMALIHMFIEATGFISEHRVRRAKNKTDVLIKPTQAICDFISDNEEAASLLNPIHMPMVVPPEDWTGPLGGGYITHHTPKMPFIKIHNNEQGKNYFADLSSVIDQMKPVYDAVNAVQRTPWRVNKPVLEVFETIWKRDLLVAHLPAREEIPEIPSPLAKDAKTDDLSDTDKERFIKWKQKEKERHQANIKLKSKRVMTERLRSIAKQFSEFEAIYFPHTLDFRGRLYPAPMYLNPQGTRLAKGLLEFSEGKALGSNAAAYELAVHGANCFGYDKVSLDSRVDWVQDNTDRILKVAYAPLSDLWWAKEADSPWCFFAFAKEWEGFQRDGYDHISHIPIAKDGSCSGLQHFSAALRDPIGAAATNLLPSEQPEDIYQRVIDLAQEKIRKDLNGEQGALAQACLDYGLSRKAAKRCTMTRVYGSTLYSSRAFVSEYIRDTDTQRLQEDQSYVSTLHEQEWAASYYLSGHIWDSINETVFAAKEGMDWLQECARILAGENLPTMWTTLDGLPVLQHYPNTNRRRIKTKFGDKQIYLSLREELQTIDRKKQANSISPNWVHANDGCHLRMTVNLAAAHNVGSFAMIHDSFGTHAADIPMLNACLRETFIELYLDNDPFEMFRCQTQMLTAANLPTAPKKGTLDLSLVRDSDFFFA